MNINLNGKKYKYMDNGSVEGLLKAIKAGSKKVAVIVNGSIIGAGERKTAKLKNNDIVDIVTLGGGG